MREQIGNLSCRPGNSIAALLNLILYVDIICPLYYPIYTLRLYLLKKERKIGEAYAGLS
jgi:hypothetical protein